MAVWGGPLPPELARYIYIVLVGVTVALVGFIVVAKSMGTGTVALDDVSDRVPKGVLSRSMVTIALRDIEPFDVTTCGDIHTLAGRNHGSEVKPRSPHFESFEAFGEFYRAIRGRRPVPVTLQTDAPSVCRPPAAPAGEGRRSSR